MKDVAQGQGTARQLQPLLSGNESAGGLLASLCFGTLFVLAGLCAMALCCELSGCLRAAQAEKPLRLEPLLPKLMVEQGEPLPVPDALLPLPEPQPSAPPAPSVEETAPPLQLPPVETMAPPRLEEPKVDPAGGFLPPLPPVTVEPPVVSAPPPVVDLCSDPVVYLHPCGSQPLESPMLRNWKTLALYSLLAALPAAPAPVVAQTTDLDKLTRRLDQLESKDAARGETLDRVQRDVKQIEELRKSLQSLPSLTQADLERMNKRLELIDDIRKDLQRLEQLDSLHKDVAQLKTRLSTVEERKPAPEVGTSNNNNQEVRSDIKKIEGMLNQIIGLQNTLQDDMQGVRKDVTGIKKEVLALQGEQTGTKVRLDTLELQLNRLADDIKTVQKRLDTTATTVVGSAPVAPVAPITPLLERGLDDIRAKLGAIEQAILRLQPSGATRSAYYQTPSAVPAATLTTGRVLLENFYPEDLLFIVNGQQTRVGPNRVVPLDAVPSGTLSYEVVSPTWGVRTQKTTSLASNETFRITAR
jgi:predicted  nucleic acid-binding Zn-ribbon protein